MEHVSFSRPSGTRRASDGGNVGCRFTPEMSELLEKTLELRAKGIIKF
ncbi:MAG: hypothetical protein ACYTG0_44300 [Planctomycetota bacterium]|jgi:hypothetical protein